MNSATFPTNVGMAPNFILRLLMPNYEVGEIGFSKFHSDTAFSKQGYFCHSVFVNRSILPIFRILKAPVPSECGNEVPFSQKSCFTVKNVHK